MQLEQQSPPLFQNPTFQDGNGLSFDGTSEWVEVSTGSCLIHPDGCSTGASIMAWVKMESTCANWGGIFGAQGSSATDNTEGMFAGCDSSGTGLK